MAADTQVFANYLIAEDVNMDFRVSPMDALLVINQLNARGTGLTGSGEFDSGNAQTIYSDVNRDGRISAIDALQVINRLNGEGEDPEILMTFSYTITGVTDPADPTSAPAISQVAIGQQFQVNVFVKDNRNPDELPTRPSDGLRIGGVASAGLDIGLNSLTLAEYVQPGSGFLSGILVSDFFASIPFLNGSQGSDTANEFFNAVASTTNDLFNPRNPPDRVTPVFSARFTATAAGTLTFNPNAPENVPNEGPDLGPDVDAENLVYGVGTVIPNERIDFGSPFSINVVADPNIPVANTDTLITRRGVNRTITNAELLANDTGVSALTVTGIQTVSGSTQGTLAGNVYTPPAGFVGNDTLRYTVQDAQGRTATGTITINVLAPIAATADSFTIQVNSTNNALDVRANDTPTGMTITQVSTPNQGGTVSIVSGTSLRYSPRADFRGTETFTYTVSDNRPDGATGTATVTISVVDRLPAAGSFTVEVNELTQDNPIQVLTHVVPNDNEDAVLVGIGTAPQHGTAEIDDNGTPSDRTDDSIDYTPTPGFVGTDTFTYIANDTSVPAQQNSTGTVTGIVKEVNFPPVLVNDTVTTLEKQGATIPIATLLANDRAFLSGQTLSLTSVAAVSTTGGSVAIQGANVVYTPSPNNFNGQFIFRYTARDNYARPLSSTATVTINVTPVNDPPVVPAATPTFRGFKNVPLTINAADMLVGVTPGPSNESTQSLSVAAVGPNATSNGNVVGTVALSGGVITFTPNQDFTGQARFDVTIRDNGGTANGGVDSVIRQAIVNVEEFLPSTVSGRAFVDEDRDGAVDARERFLGGIEVTLTGTSLGQAVAPQSVLTLADGSYEFDDLGPGNYRITFHTPEFMLASSQFGPTHDVQIVQPGGANLTQNYAVVGLTAQYAQWISQLVSSYYYQDPSLAYRGAYFAIGSDNSLRWGLNLDGYADAKFAEAVFDGDALLLTVVDANHEVHTTRIERGHFAVVRDAAGNALVRIIGPSSNYVWQDVNLAAPPFSASKYLDAIDEVFEQQDWGNET